MSEEKQDFKIFSIVGIIASLVFVPVERCSSSGACINTGWEWIFKLDYYESVNFGLLFIQVLIMVILISGYYHIKFKD